MLSTADHIEESLHILKRLRQCLLQQREKFSSYLNLLAVEEKAIISGDAEKIENHIQLEQSIVQEIFTLQQVINPLEDLYSRAYPEGEESIPELKGSLDRLREKVLLRNESNRRLLKEQLNDLLKEIKCLKRRYRNSSPYSNIPVPSLVDITS